MPHGIRALLGLCTLLASGALSASPPARPSPAPAATPAFALEGTVKGPDGKPIEGALIVARSMTGAYAEPVESVRTDAQGRFRLPLKRGGIFNVRAEAQGLAPWTNEKVRPGEPLAIALGRGFSIHGLVRDGHSGAAVAGARVRVAVGVGPIWEPEAGLVETTTDALGRFRLEGLARGRHDVAVRARGYAKALRSAVPAGGRVEFSLFPGASLAGVVYDAEGGAVAGAVVALEAESRRSSRTRPERTDARGRFEFLGIDSGTYALVARHAGLAPAVVPGLLVERDADARAEIVMSRGAVVSGRLLGSEETPVAGRVVVRELSGRPVSAALAEVLRAEASADGRFRLERLPPGSHALAVFSAGHAPQRLDFDVGPKAMELQLGDVFLEAGLAIRGRVHDTAGNPLADVRVDSYPMRSPVGGPADALSRADGTFTLDGLSPGTHRVHVRASGFAEQTRSAEAGAQGLDFVLQPGGTITGTVVGPGGGALEGFQVTAQPTAPDRSIRPRFKSFDDPDGRFALEDLAEAVYVLQVSAPDYAAAAVSDVEVPAGGSKDLGRIRLGRGGVVRGSVTDAQGAPVAGATIVVQIGGEAMYVGFEPKGVSDAGGSFEVRGVPAGTGFATAQHPEYADGRSAPFEVDPERGPVEVRIPLSRGGRIEGVAHKRDGTPVGGGMVMLFPYRGGMSREATLRPDGSFALERVPVGRSRVMLMQGEGGRLAGTQSREVEVREGETALLEFIQRDILVFGHVRRSGVAAPSMRISVHGNGMGSFRYTSPDQVPPSPTGPQRTTALSREDGSYELLVDEPGMATVVVETVDGALTLPARRVEIPDAESFTLDLDFNGTLVDGIVLDKQTQQPLAESRIQIALRRDQSQGTGSGWSVAGADGRFQLELEDGEYRLTVNAEGYASQTTDVSLPGASATLVVFLARGAPLQGKVVDLAGRGVANVELTAASAEGTDAGGWAHTFADGSFQFTSLARRRYNVLAGGALSGYAVAAGVLPGEGELQLRLRPPARVQLAVRAPDGSPVQGAHARCILVDGAPVSGVSDNPSTDAHGNAELLLPAGRLQVDVWKNDLKGSLTVAVAEGDTTSAEVQLVSSQE